MKAIVKTGFIGTSLVLALCADVTPEAPLGVQFVADAQAVVGMPLTPLSYAGVARRTAVRTTAVVSAEAATAAAASKPPPPQPAAAPVPPPATGQPLPLGTVVQTLPAGCTSTPVGGVNYFYCGGNFYRAAFQGNNVIYVTAQP